MKLWIAQSVGNILTTFSRNTLFHVISIYAFSDLQLLSLPDGVASGTVYGASWTEYFSQNTYTDTWVPSVTPYIKNSHTYYLSTWPYIISKNLTWLSTSCRILSATKTYVLLLMTINYQQRYYLLSVGLQLILCYLRSATVLSTLWHIFTTIIEFLPP